MFKRAAALCFSLLALLLMGLGFFLLRVSDADLAKAKKVLEERELASSKTLFNTTQQQRKGVVKDLWLTQEDGTRLHYKIASETSQLTIQPTGKKFDLIEKLEKIQCWMQDKLYAATPAAPPMQQLRLLQAQEGLYRFTTQEFLAQTVTLSLYRIQGHELPLSLNRPLPFLKGIAEDVSFSVSGKNPQFNAQHFKAEFNAGEVKK